MGPKQQRKSKMKRKDSLFLIGFILCAAQSVSAQTLDSLIFSYDDFIQQVKEHHPISIQATNKGLEGSAYLLKAKGGFDPKLEGEMQQKYYNGSQYYSNLATGLKVPTWFGISAQAGYDQTGGVYLNPERTLPTTGLWYAGLSVNLGKGLFIDERRAELKQAQIYAQSTEMERQLIMNQLVYDASASYWEWFKSYHYLKVYEQALSASEIRFNNVKQFAEFGDKPFIDTVEAVVQYLNQQVNYEQGLLDWKNKTKKLEVYLWQDGLVPLEFDSLVQPQKLEQLMEYNLPLNINEVADSLLANHPKLLLNQYKVDFSKIENRLNLEALKPVVALKYNAISAMQDPNLQNNYAVTNYTWGATVSYPLFTRKERGQVRISELKIQNLEANFALEQQQLRNAIEISINTNKTSWKQLQINKQNVENYKLLLNSEQRLYGIGESSLFMVNSRELSYMKAQQAYIEILTNFVMSKYYLNYQLVENVVK